jgi:DNA-dependent RNA polymerase auxiliary subunit epsilon
MLFYTNEMVFKIFFQSKLIVSTVSNSLWQLYIAIYSNFE